jgi:uncharacterized membrane protein YobD (UPF0266 family)
LEILQLLILVCLLLLQWLNWFKHGSTITPNLKAMCLLACNFHLQETEKHKVGMLQWQIFNTNVIKIFQGVEMVNYAERGMLVIEFYPLIGHCVKNGY